MPDRTLERAMAALAALLLMLVTARAVLTLDPYFDAMSYHLSFAGRMGGVCPQEGCYRLGDYMETAYQGYPKLFHALQGLVWRVTGLAQAVDLVNVAALVLFGVFLRHWFAVPVAWTVCALLAVPLVQIQATATLVDLPVNLCMAVFVLGFMAFVRAPAAMTWPRLALMAAGLAAAANGKPQLIGPAALLGGAFAATAIGLFATGRQVGPLAPGRLGSWVALAAGIALVAALTSAKAIDNAIEHGNPFYPVHLKVGPIELPGPADPAPALDSMAPYWASTPVPLRWLASVLELGAYDHRETPWTFDQGYCASALDWQHCWRPAGRAFHMGGYFVPYVLALAGFVGWRTRRMPRRDRWVVLGALAATTLAVCTMPRSHELRYYMFWMIVLVSLALATTFEPSLAGRARRAASARGLLAGARRLLAGIVLVTLAAVATMSHGRYLDPTAPGARQIIQRLGIDTRVAQVPDGAVVCVHPDWQPFTYLFAPVHHAGRRYEARDGRVGGLDGKGSDCSVWVPSPR